MELAFPPKTASVPQSILKLTLLALLLVFAFPLMHSLADTPPAATDPAVQMEQRLLQRLNEIRADHNLPALTLDARLSDAARAHVAEAQARDWMSHTGADGSSYTQRIQRAGYVPLRANETIGWGYSLERQINWWMNSRVHRSIILSPEYTQVGIGYRGDPARTWGHWWVVNYATHK